MSLAIQARFTASGADALSLLFANKVDMAYMGTTPFLLAKTYGLPVHLLAISQPLTKSHGIVLRQDKVDCYGKCSLQLATTLGSTGHQLGREWALKRSVDVRFIHLQPKHHVDAFICGYVDGIASWQPFVTLCEMSGGVLVFSASDLEIPIYNALVATHTALTSKRAVLTKLLEVQAQAVAGIKAASLDNFLGMLPHIFSMQIPPPRYRQILEDSPVWPEEIFWSAADAPNVVRVSMEESLRFLAQERLSGGQTFSPEECFAPADHSPAAQPDGAIALGYTDSMMCAPFHFARGEGIFAAHGFTFIADSLRTEDRMLELSPQFRKRLMEIIRLKDSSGPELALTEMRRTLESLLRDTYAEFFGKQAPKGLEQIIEAVYHGSRGAMPSEVYSAAHWIRVIGNSAVHDSGSKNPNISKLQYENALPQLLSTIEWADGPRKAWLAAKRACFKCSEELDRSWNRCPACRKYMGATCYSCQTRIELNWRNCAKCNANLEGD